MMKGVKNGKKAKFQTKERKHGKGPFENIKEEKYGKIN